MGQGSARHHVRLLRPGGEGGAGRGRIPHPGQVALRVQRRQLAMGGDRRAVPAEGGGRAAGRRLPAGAALGLDHRGRLAGRRAGRNRLEDGGDRQADLRAGPSPAALRRGGFRQASGQRAAQEPDLQHPVPFRDSAVPGGAARRRSARLDRALRRAVRDAPHARRRRRGGHAAQRLQPRAVASRGRCGLRRRGAPRPRPRYDGGRAHGGQRRGDYASRSAFAAAAAILLPRSSRSRRFRASSRASAPAASRSTSRCSACGATAT